MPISVATEIPGIDTLLLSSSGNNIVVDWEADIDNGSVQFELREAGTNTWQQSETVSYDSDPVVFDDLNADNEYEIRGRGTGEYDMSEWSDYESFITLYIPIRYRSVTAKLTKSITATL